MSDKKILEEVVHFSGDRATQVVIDKIWATYDIDNSGSLDKQEFMMFMRDTLALIPSSKNAVFSQDAFEDIFTTYD